MRNALTLFAALCLVSATSGCHSKSEPVVKPVEPTPKADEQARLDWTLKFQAQCSEGIEKNNCLGSHGFTIQTTGEYQVGPGPQGETRKGTLTPEELTQVTQLLASSLSALTQRSDGHERLEASLSPEGVEESITLTKTPGSQETLAQSKGNDLFFRTPSAEEAKALMAGMRGLVTHYYPLPFPDDCKDGSANLQTLYNSMQTCATDNDCVYLNTSFETVAANSSEELVSDDCSLVKPLNAGNAETVRLNLEKLLAQLDLVRQACGDVFVREGCTEITTFALTGAAATCQQGVCKAAVSQ